MAAPADSPKMVTLEELRIESAFPLDEETRRVCTRFEQPSGTV